MSIDFFNISVVIDFFSATEFAVPAEPSLSAPPVAPITAEMSSQSGVGNFEGQPEWRRVLEERDRIGEEQLAISQAQEQARLAELKRRDQDAQRRKSDDLARRQKREAEHMEAEDELTSKLRKEEELHVNTQRKQRDAKNVQYEMWQLNLDKKVWSPLEQAAASRVEQAREEEAALEEKQRLAELERFAAE